MQEKGFWDDIKRAEEVTKESKSIKDKIDRYESLVRRLDDVEVLAELAEDDEETINEVIIEIKDIEKKIDEYKIELLLSGEYDKNDAILSLHAGVGGSDANDWTLMLLRMYTRWCEKKGYKVETLDLLEGDEAGIKSATLDKFEYGFRAGVKAANPNCELTVRYLNSFSDSALAKSVANQMHKDGVDVIYTAAGAAGTGAIEAAKENNKMAIGVDVDQSPLAPDNIISSTMKNVNVSIVNLVGEILEDNYQGGQVIVNTLASGGVGLSDTTKDHVSKDILDYVNEQAGKIKSGEIVVPENEKQYNEIVGK